MAQLKKEKLQELILLMSNTEQSGKQDLRLDLLLCIGLWAHFGCIC